MGSGERVIKLESEMQGLGIWLGSNHISVGGWVWILEFRRKNIEICPLYQCRKSHCGDSRHEVG